MPALQHRRPPAQKPGIKFTGENRYTRRMISVLRAKVGLAVRGFSAAKTTFNCRSIGNTGSFVCLWDCAEISCFNQCISSSSSTRNAASELGALRGLIDTAGITVSGRTARPLHPSIRFLSSITKPWLVAHLCWFGVVITTFINFSELFPNQ